LEANVPETNEVAGIGRRPSAAGIVVFPDRRAYPLTRAYFAVEPRALKRAVAEAFAPIVAAAVDRIAGQELSVTALSFAASLGVDAAGAATPAQRLVREVGNELWYIGSFPSWLVSALLQPLGADAEDAVSLMQGHPLSGRDDLVDVLAGVDPTADLATGLPSQLTILDGNQALAWRGMLRAAVNAYTSADGAFVAEFARAAGLKPSDDADCIVLTLLASLTAVVDFAADGHEVLIGTSV
jgi:hypothetical protein